MFFFRTLSEKPLRLPRLSPFRPGPNDPAIFGFNQEREDIVREVTQRAVTKHGSNKQQLEISLNNAAFHEIKRLSRQKDRETKDSLGYWKGIIRRIARMSDEEKRKALERTARRMADDVAGNFDPRVYRMSENVVPRLLTGVMQPSQLPSTFGADAASALDSLLLVEGDVERLRSLQNRGTLVFVPTHSSNLDSIVLGHALQKSGLSPCVYGAGKNLFTNPIISFFMHNLGAYRVDRRIRADIYKDILKIYSQVVIERGYHSLFFPGGTRSRSNLIENRLKLGLAGSAVNAFSWNQAHGVNRPVWFVPTTINYALVLEAETLIEDWLSEEGKGRYIIEDDEFSRVDRWVSFFRKLVDLQAACIVRFGAPIDPFGNKVSDLGESLSPFGDPVDPASYVTSSGKPTEDAARDAAYTRDLSETLIQEYRKESVMMTEHVVAHVLFRRLVHKTPGLDLFSRLRLRGEVAMSRDQLRKSVGETRDRLVSLEGYGQTRVSSLLRSQTPNEMIQRSLAVWNGYHSRTAARDLGVEITAEDPTLLLYYQNRLVPFAEAIAPDEEMSAARELSVLGVARR